MNIKKLIKSNSKNEVIIVNVNKMNYCLDSTDRFFAEQLGIVVAYNRGNKKNQIWTISNGINDNHIIITDNQNRRLATDIGGNVGTISNFPENDLMFNWEIVERVVQQDIYGYKCGEIYIRNVFNGKYLRVSDDNHIYLNDLKLDDKRQVWYTFETTKFFKPPYKYVYISSPAGTSDAKDLVRTWEHEQKMQAFTITDKRNFGWVHLDSRWAIQYSEGGADNTIKNFDNSLISRDGYAMVYTGTGSYDDQYWFIDKIPGYKYHYIITNRRDGKILKAKSKFGEKATVEYYTLFSTGNVNNNQYWFFDDFIEVEPSPT